MKKIFHIQGMHCKSCELLLESACKDIPTLSSAHASSKKGTLEIEAHHINNELEKKIHEAVYDLGYEMGTLPTKNTSPLLSQDASQWTIVLLTVLLICIFLLLQKDQGRNLDSLMKHAGSWNLLFYPLIMGLIAGISTCMAMVWGIVASFTAKRNEQHQSLSRIKRFIPQLYFQGGRVFGFIALGGLLGLLGNVFLFDAKVMAIASILVGGIMLILWLDLTKLFPRIHMMSLRLPFFESSRPRGGAFLWGVLSFFLPCGFTLSMQLLAISSGNTALWALIMGSFALGTLPGLLGIGGILSRSKGMRSKILFSSVGVLTVFFGGYTINQGIHLLGYNPTESSSQTNSQTSAQTTSPIINTTTSSAQDQSVITKTMQYTTEGMSPQELILERGKHYQIDITPEITEQGCMSTMLLPWLDSHIAMIQKGETIHFNFTADKAGSYEFTCAMGLSHNAKIIIK